MATELKFKLGDVVWIPECKALPWYHEDPMVRFVVVNIFIQKPGLLRAGEECLTLITIDDKYPRFEFGNSVFASTAKLDVFMTAARKAALSIVVSPVEA